MKTAVLFGWMWPTYQPAFPGASQPAGSCGSLKHTIRVFPGRYVDLDMTTDAPGDWAFHCHLLYHMHAGMMRVVSVRPLERDAS